MDIYSGQRRKRRRGEPSGSDECQVSNGIHHSASGGLETVSNWDKRIEKLEFTPAFLYK